MHLWIFGMHFCDFLGVFLGAVFWGLSNGSPGASESVRQRARACESVRERARACESNFMHSPGRGFREGKPLPKGTLGKRGLRNKGRGI